MNAEKNAELIDISDHMEKAVCGYLFTHGECRRILYDTLQIDIKIQNIIYKNRRVLKKFLQGLYLKEKGYESIFRRKKCVKKYKTRCATRSRAVFCSPRV